MTSHSQPPNAATVTLDFAFDADAVADASHNPELTFTRVSSSVPAFTYTVTGSYGDVVAYLTDYYTEGDATMLAELVARIV